MMQYWFCYNSNGAIVYPPTKSPTNPWPNPPATYTVVSYDVETAAPDVLAAYLYPDRYLFQGSPAALVLQPYWTLTATESTATPGQYTVTATLNNPPATPPTTATFAVAGATYSEAVASNKATLTLQIHPTISDQQVDVQVSASGTVDGSLTIGTGPQKIGQQSWTDANTVNWVGPGGIGSLDYVMGADASTLSQAQQINAIAVVLGELTDLVHGTIIPSMQQASYTPLALDADQDNAFKDITANVTPKIVTKLGSLYPSGGTEMPTYAQMKTALATIQQAVKATNTALTAIPNLK